MRGKRRASAPSLYSRRIIPARAGQTTAGLTARNTGTDHPRACGANNLSIWTPWPATGSSPRVRGKQRDVGQVAANQRIIPARAGQTLVQKSMTSCNADHPRACGANAQVRFEGGIDHGSSPRVRGKRLRKAIRSAIRRIIPARAGQTSAGLDGADVPPDHPRACGANHECRPLMVLPVGSSPRVRGKLAGLTRGFPRLRIIPARAGQTDSKRRASPTPSDHPRACGANSRSVSELSTSTGSSPRVRGKHRVQEPRHGQSRIIPARAGQTVVTISLPVSKPDHPRACGANALFGKRRVRLRGSSPRVRGKLQGRRRFQLALRIIPARAGQTR